MAVRDFEQLLAAMGRAERPIAERVDGEQGLPWRVAVLPAAFNPPTKAHAELLRRAAALEGGSGAAALLTTRNVDKGVFGAGLEERLGMLLALREELPGLAVLVSNAARLADQGEALRARFPGVAFDFVVGYDTLVRLFDRRYYEDMEVALKAFFGAHRLIAANRGEAGPESVRAFLGAPGLAPYRARVGVLELGPEHASISSSGFRAGGGAAGSMRQVPASVAAYIERSGLYR